MSHVLRRVAVAAASLALPAVAAAADYGVGPPSANNPDFHPFWTKVYADGTNAWEKAAAAALRGRGFSEKQIAKLVRLAVEVGSEQNPRGRESRAELSSPPMRFDTETGARLPEDPLAYAAALPDCYKTDERNCSLTYSPNTETRIGSNMPCMMPRRTIFFCRKAGFQNLFTWNKSAAERAQVKIYAPFCGEQDRGGECGADQIVFDAQAMQTKLAFDVGKAENGAAPPAAEAIPTPPRIVYRINKYLAFTRREGPKELEEWEYDAKAWLRYLAKHNEIGAEKGYAKVDARFANAMRYCWAHDVFHPCGLY